jgi:hypothetical protein
MITTALGLVAACFVAYLMAARAAKDADLGFYGWAALGAAVSGGAIALAVAIVIGSINTAGVN